MVDLTAQATWIRAIQRVGVPVTLQRVVGFAPNTTLVSAAITAVVRMARPDTTDVGETGYAAGKPGSISQTDRDIIMIEQDLINAAFPLPVKKNDKVLLSTGDLLNITDVDSFQRAMPGVINAVASGVK